MASSSDVVHVPFSPIGFRLANVWMCQHLEDKRGSCSVGGSNVGVDCFDIISKQSEAWVSSSTKNIFEFVTEASFEFPVTPDELSTANAMQIRCYCMDTYLYLSQKSLLMLWDGIYILLLLKTYDRSERVLAFFIIPYSSEK